MNHFWSVPAKPIIGGLVADTAIKLGMKVLGFDPDITVDGFDVDPDSIAVARRHAESYGLEGRVSFTLVDVADVPEQRTGGRAGQGLGGTGPVQRHPPQRLVGVDVPDP